MTVYLDLVMGLNFLVDLLLILGTNRLSGFSNGTKRAVLAAGLGSIYSGACMLPAFRFLANTLWRVVSLCLMGAIAFGVDRSAGKRIGVFALLSMAMGGIAVGFGRSDLATLLLSALAVWLLCKVGFGNRVGERTYVKVVIRENGREIALIALQDTGNTLSDPVTGEQVLVISTDAAQKLTGLRQEELEQPMETMLKHQGCGFRLIPYQSVGQSAGMLLGKRFRDVTVGNRKGSALVAFAPQKIGQGEIYQALAGGTV